jgi:hypothetical protein
MNDDRTLSSQPQQQTLRGLGFMLIAMSGFFASMAYFHLFGHAIQYQPKELVPVSFLLLGIYGLGYAFGGTRLGFRYLRLWAILVIAAAVVGFIRVRLLRH